MMDSALKMMTFVFKMMNFCRRAGTLQIPTPSTAGTLLRVAWSVAALAPIAQVHKIHHL